LFLDYTHGSAQVTGGPHGLSALRRLISAPQCDDVALPKVQITLTIDEDVLSAVKLRAAQTGNGESEVIEDALRRELSPLDGLVQKGDLDEDAALALAVEAQHETRPSRQLSARRGASPTR
jgi:Ribbon-helix-helix protein, copG family